MRIWECAAAPPVEEVLEVAAQRAGSVMLIDTHCKEANNVIRKTRPTLLDWMSVDSIASLCERAREVKIKIALAGSLGVHEIIDSIAREPRLVRGARCRVRRRRPQRGRATRARAKTRQTSRVRRLTS